MTTKKDLVEANSFSRRRLVTAFVSGAPGGREVETARPGRAIVGGVALAVLLVAGAAVAGALSSNVDPSWAEKAGLIISKEGAGVFVIAEASTEPVLHPVLNVTSAKLILGSDVEPQVISEEHIAEVKIGSDLGILGAPYDVPEVSRLIESGWTACTDGIDGGLRLNLSEDEPVTPVVKDGGMLVSVDGVTWLVATSRPDAVGTVSAFRYRVPQAGSGPQQLALAGIGLGQGAGEVTEVGRKWLDLFPEAGEISPTAFGVTPRAARGDEPVPGDLLLVNGKPYLTVASGALAPLDPFALAVAVGGAGGVAPAYYRGDVAELDFERGVFLDARWPDTTLAPVFGERCVRLLTEAGRPSVVQLVQEPEGEAAATGTKGKSVVVDAGAGAYVLASGWEQGEGGAPFVIDAQGYAHPVVGPEAPGLLGYAGYGPPVVPDSWVELLTPGVELSQSAALCAPRAGDMLCR